MKTRSAELADAITKRMASDQRLDRISFTDYSELPDQLEREIDAGRMRGVISLYRLTELEPGRARIGSMVAGMTPREAFDTLCLIRRSMMTTLGFRDALEPDEPAPMTGGKADGHGNDHGHDTDAG